MEQRIASEIVRAIVMLNEQIGSIDLAVSKIPDEQEKREYVMALGNLFKVIREGFLLKILKEHPELNPYKQ